MDTKQMTTYNAKPSDIESRWHLIDATGRPLGRLAVEIAYILQGKHKPTYTPHMLTGDFVVLINASKVGITGRKLSQKIYYSHSGYPGGLKASALEQMLTKHPDRVIKKAVKGMLPKNILARHMLKRLKVYPAADHPHHAQITGTPKNNNANLEANTVEE
jgi:large subunit ribosomal protein L13